PYKGVRHPMYFGALFMTLFTPPALGSYVALPFLALALPVLVLRLLNEEKVLRQELPGYFEYCEGTRHRLIPYIWYSTSRRRALDGGIALRFMQCANLF